MSRIKGGRQPKRTAANSRTPNRNKTVHSAKSSQPVVYEKGFQGGGKLESIQDAPEPVVKELPKKKAEKLPRKSTTVVQNESAKIEEEVKTASLPSEIQVLIDKGAKLKAVYVFE